MVPTDMEDIKLLSAVNDWKPVPGGTLPYASGVSNSTIQSGQAFFVYSTGTASFVQQNSKLNFTENCKAAGNNVISFTRKVNTKPNEQIEFLRASLFAGTSSTSLIADGNAVAFSMIYSDKVDANDAIKIPNGGENFAVLRGGKLLAIEARQSPTSSDTLYYYVNNIRQQTYQLRFAPENWQDFSLQPLFYDSYLNTRTPISLTDSTFINVTFTSDPASRASGRFMVVFRQLPGLPVSFISLNTCNTSSGLSLNWICNYEEGLNNYEVRYSNDGINFQTVTTIPVNPQKNGNYTLSVDKPKPGNNFYRIRSRSITGEPLFSTVQKIFVPEDSRISSIMVAPNPLSNGLLRLYFSNQPKGIYHVRIITHSRQTVYTGSVNFEGGSSFVQFLMKN